MTTSPVWAHEAGNASPLQVLNLLALRRRFAWRMSFVYPLPGRSTMKRRTEPILTSQIYV